MSLLSKKMIKLTDNNSSPSSRMSERDHSQFEVAPLLNDGRDSMASSEQDEADLLASPLHVSSQSLAWNPQLQSQRSSHNSRRRATSKKSCIILCCILTILPILSFILFSSIYFTASSLPPIPAEKQTVPTTPPRLLTFNMFMRPPGIKNNKDDFKNERLEYIVQNILPFYDIITIQEAFAYANRRIDTLISAAFDQGFYYQVASQRHYPWDLGGDGGLLILSRYPIQKSDRIEFPRGVHSDW